MLELAPLAALHSPAGRLVSVYLSKPPGPSAAAALSDLLKPLRAAADGMDRAGAKSLRADCDRIHDLAPRLDADPAPAAAVFASAEDGIFEYLPLTVPVWDHASVGHRPYLRPLRAVPPPLHSAVAVVERQRVRLYRARDGEVEQLAELGADLGKPNYGGFHGYEERSARSHAEAETTHLLRRAAAALAEEHQRRPFDLLAIGGHEETAGDLVPHLHPYLRSLEIATFVVDPGSLTLSAVREKASELAEEVRRHREVAQVEAVATALASGERAVAGSLPVVEAVNARAVDLLVVAGTFTKPGWACASCRWLSRTEDTCAMCGERMSDTEDVLAAAAEQVLDSGGRFLQTTVASPLDAPGVAATLRFPLPAPA